MVLNHTTLPCQIPNAQLRQKVLWSTEWKEKRLREVNRDTLEVKGDFFWVGVGD